MNPRKKSAQPPKRSDNQIDRARVLEVRIHLPPAESRANFGTRLRYPDNRHPVMQLRIEPPRGAAGNCAPQTKWSNALSSFPKSGELLVLSRCIYWLTLSTLCQPPASLI